MNSFCLLLIGFFSFSHFVSTPLMAKDPEVFIVKSKVMVSKQSMTILDFLETPDASSELHQVIQGIPLGPPPEFGEPRVFSDRSLAALLRYNMSLFQKELGEELVGRIKLKIPHEVIVERSGLQIVESEIKTELIQHWKSNCQKCTFEFIQLVVKPKKIYSPTAKWSLIMDQQTLRGPFTGRLEVVDNNKFVDRVWIRGTAKAHLEVPVAQRILHIGNRIGVEDFKVMRKDVTLASDTSPSDTTLVGSKLVRGVRPNQVIWNSDLEREKAIQKGDTIEVMSVGKGWNVTMKGVSQDSGWIGDVIRIMNPQSKKIFSARIVNRGLAEVH